MHRSIRALSGPLAIFVHRENPVASLTIDQVARTLRLRPSGWADLGAEGERPARHEHLRRRARHALALSLEANAMVGREFGKQMRGFPQSADVVQRITEDPYALGFAAAMRATPAVCVVPITSRSGAEPVAPTSENIMGGRYPLARFLLIYARRPLISFAREFLRLVLSRGVQEAVAASPQGYLPLSSKEAAAEGAKME